jgi:flagellar motor switch protein FliM
MSQQILSQDEVDALLQGITGESQKLDKDDAPQGGIRDYDISSQERIVRGRMPTMELINDRFARALRNEFSKFFANHPKNNVRQEDIYRRGLESYAKELGIETVKDEVEP